MGIFKKKPEKILIDDRFNEPQPLNNGNNYDVYQQLKVQKNIDLSTLPSIEEQYGEVLSIIEQMNKEFFTNFTIDDYYLLLLHSNYFCNTIVFECNDTKLRRIILQVIRQAWLHGRSGIYFDKKVNKAYGIIINNIEFNTYGEIEKITYLPLSLVDGLEYDKLQDKFKNPLTIKGVEECENVCVFNWGTLHISAFILYFPFVKLQNMLLKMGNAQAFAFNKKYFYKTSNPKQSLQEMKLWYNPHNIFIITTEDFTNRFKQNQNNTDGAVDFIEYYKQLCGMYYSLYGRRMNLDFKKERNTVEEVSMTSGAIENIERDWLNQFEIFVEELKDVNKKFKIFKNLQIENVKLNNWTNEERQQGQFDDGNPSISKKGDNNAI